MANKPSLIERQALGNLLQVLTDKNPTAYGDYLWESFEDREPIKDSDISGTLYYATLRSYPLVAKRWIIQSVLTGWNVHHDLTLLYESINTLIYLGMCGPAEYFLMVNVFNFLSSFGRYLESTQFAEIESHRPNEYTLRFWKDERGSWGDTYGIIDFQLHGVNEPPVLAIVPWFGILKNVDIISDEDNPSQESLESSIYDIYKIMNDEFPKKHCPWIHTEWEISHQREELNRGIVIILHSLVYIDNNGRSSQL